MRWIKKQKPKFWHGQKDFVKRYAFLPTTLDDGYVVWLEWYCEERVYKEHIGNCYHYRNGEPVADWFTERKYAWKS